MPIAEPRRLREPEARAAVDAVLLRKLLTTLGRPPVRFILWDGEEVAASEDPPVARVRVTDRGTLLRLLADPELEFGEAYMDGRLTVEGDLPALLEEFYRHSTAVPGEQPTTVRLRPIRWLQAVRSNTLSRSRRNIQHHYDISNEFYALWLDESLAYTCAYFSTPTATLHEAQVAKMNHIGRKLGLRPGQSVIEAGCGWGSLALHLARQFGVRVTAFNISHQQILYARECARAQGLAGQVEYIEDDYRNIPRAAADRCDAFVSVGMLEHVGLDHYRELGEVIHRCLKPSGLGLIHSIGRNRPEPVNRWILKRIFPGGYVPSLKEMMDMFEPWDFSVLDVENLRLHYARTLDCWSDAFERAHEQVARMFDESFVRMWRLYLTGSATAFRAGRMQLFQIVFAPQGNNDVPWTREHLYLKRDG